MKSQRIIAIAVGLLSLSLVHAEDKKASWLPEKCSYLLTREFVQSNIPGKTISIKFSNYMDKVCFYIDHPDTVFVTKKKKPVINKDYFVTDAYEHKAHSTVYSSDSFYTPNDVFDGNEYTALEYNFSSLKFSDKKGRKALVGQPEIQCKELDEIGSEIARHEMMGKVYYLSQSRKTELSDFIKCTCVDVNIKLGKISNTGYFSPYIHVILQDESGTRHEANQYSIVISEEEYAALLEKDLAIKRESGHYTFVVCKVDKPTSSVIRPGKMTKTGKIVEYKDNIMDIQIGSDGEIFVFNLKNISNSTLKIVWDDAAYVSTDGSVSKVMHNGIRYSERNEHQVPTTIPKEASIDDSITPTDNVFYVNGWGVNTLIYVGHKYNEKYIGKKVKVLLPIEYQGKIYEYTFHFNVDWEYDYPELRKMN